MSNTSREERIHNLDVTVWVGKNGIEAVSDELSDQLQERDFVKVKFLRAARGGTETDSLAADLAEMVNGAVVRTRGHTAVIER
jgi:RNA-binding protein